jgi:hypothetical protein
LHKEPHPSNDENLNSVEILDPEKTNSQANRKKFNKKSYPKFLQRLLESEAKFSFKEIEELVQEIPTNGKSQKIEEIMSERCKVNSLLHLLRELSKGKFDSDKEQEMMLTAILKKIRYDIVNLQIKANNLDDSSTTEANPDFEVIRNIIHKEFDQFNNFYSNFVEDCKTILANTEPKPFLESFAVKNTDSNFAKKDNAALKHLELRRQIEKPFEFDRQFFKDVLVGMVRDILETINGLKEISTNVIGNSGNLKS